MELNEAFSRNEAQFDTVMRYATNMQRMLRVIVNMCIDDKNPATAEFRLKVLDYLKHELNDSKQR